MAVAPIMASQNIPLAQVIEFSIQRTYQELLNLAELLPRKTDMERKIDIYRFAHRTRQLFVRLYALVKWAKNGYKIDKCMNIMGYLDQQCMFYIDTANQLSNLARDTLVQARLPSFSIPAAVDVLTSGTYPRLPTCIRDKIIPPDPITELQKTTTLDRLTQIIEFRLITSDIPKTFKQLTTYNGRLKLLVDNEFSAVLTVMGDSPVLPWRLLEIELLVEDCNSRDGRPLVHDMQVQYLHALVQSRLVDTPLPLHELYNILHSFCQTLQLEVLYTQAQKLVHESLNCTIKIDSYKPCRSLVISYWRPKAKNKHQQQLVTNWMYRLDIHVSEKDPHKPLAISHHPIPASNDTPLPYHLKSNQLSIEKILLETAHAWSNIRLKELQHRLEVLNTVSNFCILDVPPTLSCKLLSSCMSYEELRITIDCSEGLFLTSLAACNERIQPLMDLQDYLNKPIEGQKQEKLLKLVTLIKLYLGVERCVNTVENLKLTYTDHIPIIIDPEHQLNQLSTHRLYVNIPRANKLYIVVTVDIDSDKPQTIRHSFYMLPVSACTFSGSDEQNDISKLYLKPGRLMRISSGIPDPLNEEEMILDCDVTDFIHSDISLNRREESCYFVNELIRVLSRAEDHILFTALADQLWSRGIKHQGVQKDVNSSLTQLTLLSLPTFNGEADEILQDVVNVTIRLDSLLQTWTVEILLAKNALDGSLTSQQLLLNYTVLNRHQTPLTVNEFINEWKSIVRLYQLVKEHVKYCSENDMPLSVHKYDYKEIVVTYGESQHHAVEIVYDSRKNYYDLSFIMIHTSQENRNPHYITSSYLRGLLNNTTKNKLTTLIQVLTETLSPLSELSKLSELASFALQPHGQKACATMTVLAQSATFIRLCYRQLYVLDIQLFSRGVISIRDAFFSMFDLQPFSTTFSATQGLKGFLSRYLESETRFTRNQSVDMEEAPPTPTNLTGLDTLEALLSGNPKPSSPVRHASGSGPTLMTASPPKSYTQPLSNISAPSPAVAPSPMGGMGSLGSPFDIQLTSPALPLSSPAPIIAQSPAITAQPMSPAMNFLNQGTPGGSDQLTSGWSNSPSQSQLNINAGISPRTGGAGTSPRPERKPEPQYRIMPQRSAASSQKTLLTHAAFARILNAASDTEGLPSSHHAASPLERFLGSSSLKRFLNKALSSDESMKDKVEIITEGVELGSLAWSFNCLRFKVSFDETYQMLKMTVVPQPNDTEGWSLEDLKYLEHYFNFRVVCPPYKTSNLRAFCRLISTPPRILKDFIQIMKQQAATDLKSKWRVEICLTMPNEVHRRVEQLQTGIPAIIIQSDKILFVLKFSRNTLVMNPDMQNSRDVNIPDSIAMAFWYDIKKECLSTMAPSDQNSTQPANQLSQAITHILKNTQQNPQYQGQYNSIFDSVLEIINQLTL